MSGGRVSLVGAAALALLLCLPVFAAPLDQPAGTDTVAEPQSADEDGAPAAGHAMPQIPSVGITGNGGQPGSEGSGLESPGGMLATEPGEVPVVEYDAAKLPEPVRRVREHIIEAAKSGDLLKLGPIMEADGGPPDLGDSSADDDPIEFLRSQSGDSEGREILAILLEVLDAGYVHVDAGTPQEMYVWPYFARYPIEKLTPPQIVELFKLIYAGDWEDMRNEGHYLFYRVGIDPAGKWRYFTAGD